MSIGAAIESFRKEEGLTQKQIADKLYVDRTFITRIEKGNRQWPESQDANLSALSWKLALKLADERTGGYISNVLEYIPNLDLHPAALKDLLLKELNEAEKALEELVLARHIDSKQRQETAERVWHEIRDVIEKAVVLQGVLEEEFRLNRKSLIQIHEYQVRKGER